MSAAKHIDDVGKHELSLRWERVGDRIVGGVGVLVVVGAAPGGPTTAGV